MIKGFAAAAIALMLSLVFPRGAQAGSGCREKQGFPLKIQAPPGGFDEDCEKSNNLFPISPKPDTFATDISLEHFEEEVLQSPLPVVVDYWYETCEPCELLAPAIERLAQEFSGRIKFVKINEDANDPDEIEKFGIKSFPTLQFYKEGKLIGSRSGSPGPSWKINLKKFWPIMNAFLNKNAASILPSLLKSMLHTPLARSFSVSDEEFRKEVLLAPIPVLFEIWTAGPSHRRFHPLVEKIAQEYSGQIKYFQNQAKGVADPSGFPILYFVYDSRRFGTLRGEEITEEAVRENLHKLLKEADSAASGQDDPYDFP